MKQSVVMLSVAVLVFGAGAMQAASIIEWNGTSVPRTGFSGTIGARILVGGSDVDISELGVHDLNQDGIPDAGMYVAIWEDASGTVVADGTVPQGATLEADGYRYVTLGSAVTLSANTYYVIGAYVGAEGFVDTDDASPNGDFAFTGANGVSFIENRYASGTAKPTIDGGGTLGRWCAATAKLDLAPPQGTISFSDLAASNITATAASLHATVNTNLTASTLVWDIEDMGTTNLSAWSGTNSLGTQSAGPVTGSATNLSADTGYVFRFYGEDGTTNGWSLAGSFATALSAAQAPVFTSAASTYNSVTLDWTDNASTETGYILQRATDAAGPFAVVAELAADTTSHIDTGVSASTTYYYQLAATNSANGSSTDFALCATNVTTAVLPIFWSNLAASAITTSNATLSAEMTGNDGTVTAYWTTNTVADPATQLWDGSDGPAAESVGTVSRTASGLSVDTLYSYAFYGTNSTDGVEGWSIAGTFATALSAAQTPEFTSTAATYYSITLNWTDNASTETGYILRRATDAAGPFAVVAELAADTTSYIDTGVSASTTYYYQLAATNSANGSSTEPAACETSAATTAALTVLYLEDFETANTIYMRSAGWTGVRSDGASLTDAGYSITTSGTYVLEGARSMFAGSSFDTHWIVTDAPEITTSIGTIRFVVNNVGKDFRVGLEVGGTWYLSEVVSTSTAGGFDPVGNGAHPGITFDDFSSGFSAWSGAPPDDSTPWNTASLGTPGALPSGTITKVGLLGVNDGYSLDYFVIEQAPPPAGTVFILQ